MGMLMRVGVAWDIGPTVVGEVDVAYGLPIAVELAYRCMVFFATFMLPNLRMHAARERQAPDRVAVNIAW